MRVFKLDSKSHKEDDLYIYITLKWRTMLCVSKVHLTNPVFNGIYPF